MKVKEHMRDWRCVLCGMHNAHWTASCKGTHFRTKQLWSGSKGQRGPTGAQYTQEDWVCLGCVAEANVCVRNFPRNQQCHACRRAYDDLTAAYGQTQLVFDVPRGTVFHDNP